MAMIMAWTAEAWPQSKGSKYELCYSMAQSPDGLGSAASFHAGCNGNQCTITVVRSNGGYLFGGVADVDWNGIGTLDGYGASQKAFLFCIRCARSSTDADGNPVPEKMNLIANHEKAIYKRQTTGPSFGAGHDLSIPDKPSGSQYGDAGGGYGGLGLTYECRVGDSANLDCGTYFDAVRFRVTDYEVYTFSLE